MKVDFNAVSGGKCKRGQGKNPKGEGTPEFSSLAEGKLQSTEFLGGAGILTHIDK